MKILWAHNFNPKNPVAGIFMKQMYSFININKKNEFDICLYYMGNLRNPLIVIFQLLKIVIISSRYDIVHAQFGSMCGWICSFARSKNKVITLRGSDWYQNLEIKGCRGIHGRFQRYLTIFSLKKYNVIIVTSNRMKKEVEIIFPGLKVTVIPSPVDTQKFFPMDKNIAKEKLDLDSSIKYFLFPVASKNNPIKRPWLIDELSRSLPGTSKILTASGIPHEDMIFLYNSVDAVLLPSVYEGWPNVIKESLLCNTPFVATDVSDLKEFSDRNPSCVVVEPEVESFLTAVINHDFERDVNELRDSIVWMSMSNLSAQLLDSYNCFT
ncbi:MAG: glycosyltransferase [Clostridia bacterium]|nr:glycosyltransferase [Clostridia bacterium]